MRHQVSHSVIKHFLLNEIDYLSFLGVTTGNILRYVRNAKNLSRESLADVLNVSLDEQEQLEHLNEPLNEQWRKTLRCFFL